MLLHLQNPELVRLAASWTLLAANAFLVGFTLWNLRRAKRLRQELQEQLRIGIRGPAMNTLTEAQQALVLQKLTERMAACLPEVLEEVHRELDVPSQVVH